MTLQQDGNCKFSSFDLAAVGLAAVDLAAVDLAVLAKR